MATETFSYRLLNWYRKAGRHDLPWQLHRTPYRVWISEVMLQQTRVSTVIPYFNSFMQHFPTVKQLAVAELDEVLHLWTGLGYYARARNLHLSARIIMQEYGGKMPDTIDELVKLPGIGRSTAGAILAISRNQRFPILDGNVRRVLARHRGVDGWPGKVVVANQLWAIATENTPRAQVADYTQAIMDLGAMVCTRTGPQCSICPVAEDCIARKTGRQQEYPGKKPRKILPVKKTVFAILENKYGEILLQQRPPAGIWGGLWSFPECKANENIETWLDTRLGYKARLVSRLTPLRHSFSHYHLDIQPVHFRVEESGSNYVEDSRYIWYSPINDQKLGLAAPVKSLLDTLQHTDLEKHAWAK